MTITSKCMSFTVQKEYGEYKHKLSISEMPSHRHGTNDGYDGYAQWDYRTNTNKKFTSLMTNANISTDSIYRNDLTVTNSVGGSQSHNNIQPSLVVYFWKRIA